MSSKIKSLSIVMITFIVLLLTGCNNNAVSFEINFDSNGGSIVESVNYDGSSTVTIPDNPTKEGFIFDGWYWDNGTFEVPFTANSLLDTPIEDDLTVYAKWVEGENIPNGSFIVHFETNGGTSLKDIYVSKDSKINIPNISKEGYSLEGWYTSLNNGSTYDEKWLFASDVVTTNVILYAKWIANAYTITFDSNEGSVVASITQDYATKVTEPTDPTKEGYTFSGWYEDEELTTAYTFSSMPADDMTLYAKWDIETYTLAYLESDDTVISSVEYTYGSDLTSAAPSDPEKEGYTFEGWDTVLPLNMPAEDITIKATYTINQYTITFDSNEGSVVASITQDYATTVTEPTDPTKEGYTFSGWYEDEELTTAYTFSSMPADDMTLYAKWALANPIYNLVDENFRSKILDFFISQQLDFNHNGIIDYDELPGITWIDASDGEIVSLEGIEIFSNLETIYLSNNSIEDISPLLQVAKLKNLAIDNNYLGTSPFRLIDQDDIDNINMLKEKGVNTFNTEKEQKVDFSNELSIQENIATWRMLVVIVTEINTVDNLGTPVYYEMTDVEIEIAKEYARMSAIVMDVLLEYKVHFDVDIYISTTPYTGELIANADNIIFATQIDEVSNLLQNYDTTLLITSLPNIDNSHEYSIYHSASGYGSFDIEKNIGTSMMYLDSNLYGYVINNIPFERELIRLQNNSILSTIWLPVHEIIHTIEYYSISKGYITWEFHNAIVQYGHSIDNWMYYDIYNPYLNGSKNPENNVEFGIVDEIWINPPGLEERD